MAVSAKTYLYFWMGALALIIGFLWLFKTILTPFILGMVIAYLLNPLVKKFYTKGIQRTSSAVIILVVFFTITTAIIAIVIPILAKESAELIDAWPGYTEQLFAMSEPYTVWLKDNINPQYIEDAKLFLKENVSKLLSISGGIANGLAAGGQAVLGMLTILVITPLVAFYMMREWPAITAWAENLIPRKHETMIKDIIRDIDVKISGFIRGQLMVAFFLGLIYAIALTIAGLNYGFLIGIISGVLSIIPLVGSIVGLLISVTVAWFQSGDLSYLAIIAAIFIVGQIVEGNLLTPKLLGDSVGLHPLWILFALMAGGSAFGIVGMLVAVPVAAIISVLFGFAIIQYKKTPLYNHKTPQATKKKIVKKKPAKKATVKKAKTKKPVTRQVKKKTVKKTTKK